MARKEIYKDNPMINTKITKPLIEYTAPSFITEAPDLLGLSFSKIFPALRKRGKQNIAFGVMVNKLMTLKIRLVYATYGLKIIAPEYLPPSDLSAFCIMTAVSLCCRHHAKPSKRTFKDLLLAYEHARAITEHLKSKHTVWAGPHAGYVPDPRHIPTRIMRATRRVLNATILAPTLIYIEPSFIGDPADEYYKINMLPEPGKNYAEARGQLTYVLASIRLIMEKIMHPATLDHYICYGYDLLKHGNNAPGYKDITISQAAAVFKDAINITKKEREVLAAELERGPENGNGT